MLAWLIILIGYESINSISESGFEIHISESFNDVESKCGSESDTRHSMATKHRIIQRRSARESIWGSRKFSRPFPLPPHENPPGCYETGESAEARLSRPTTARSDKVFPERRKNKAGQLRHCRALEKYNRNNKLPRTMRAGIKARLYLTT